MLFNPADDPGEHENLIGKQLPVEAELKSALDECITD